MLPGPVLDAQIVTPLQSGEVTKSIPFRLGLQQAIFVRDDVVVVLRRRRGADDGRSAVRCPHRPRLDGLLSLQSEHLSSLTAPQTLPIPPLDLDRCATPLAIQFVALSPDPCADGALDFHSCSVFRNPHVGAETLDSPDTSEEMQAARNVVEQHGVAFRPPLLLRCGDERNRLIEEKFFSCFSDSFLKAFVDFSPPFLNQGNGSDSPCFKRSRFL